MACRQSSLADLSDDSIDLFHRHVHIFGLIGYGIPKAHSWASNSLFSHFKYCIELALGNFTATSR